MTIARHQSKWEGSECRAAIRSAGVFMAHLPRTNQNYRLSDECPLSQAAILTFPRGPPVTAPIQSTNRSLSCIVLCHPSQRKKAGPRAQVTGNPTFRLQMKKGPGYFLHPPGPRGAQSRLSRDTSRGISLREQRRTKKSTASRDRTGSQASS